MDNWQATKRWLLSQARKAFQQIAQGSLLFLVAATLRWTRIPSQVIRNNLSCFVLRDRPQALRPVARAKRSFPLFADRLARGPIVNPWCKQRLLFSDPRGCSFLLLKQSTGCGRKLKAHEKKKSVDTGSRTELIGGTIAVKVAISLCQLFLVVVFSRAWTTALYTRPFKRFNICFRICAEHSCSKMPRAFEQSVEFC